MEPFEWTSEHAVCVVMASQGYPGAFKSGLIIRGVDADLGENVTLFHSGTTRDLGNQLLTRGGRVFGITACGLNLETASSHAYKAVEKVSWGNNEQVPIERISPRLWIRFHYFYDFSFRYNHVHSFVESCIGQ